MANVYVGSVQWTAVTAWAALTSYSSASNGGRGDYRRQLAAPATNSERVFRCTTGGISGAAEPTWTLTKNATTADATVVWTECTGQEADQVSGTWKAPHARLKNALTATWMTSGDVAYVAHDHAETQATANSWGFQGTWTLPNLVICVLATGTVPPVVADLRTTGACTTTGNSAVTIGNGTGTGGNGCGYIYGLTFNAGTGAVNATLGIGDSSSNGGGIVLENCTLKKLGTTATASAIRLSTNGNSVQAYCELINTTVEFGATGDSIGFYGKVIWRDTNGAVAVAGATLPTTLLTNGAGNQPGWMLVENVDLSNISGTLASLNGASNLKDVTFKNCKIHASATPSASITAWPMSVSLIRADSGATNYLHSKLAFGGSQVVETTIVRTGGASDGTTPIAWKVVTTATIAPNRPFESMPIDIWNSSTSSITVTAYGIWGGGAVPTNADLWFEASYLSSGSTPLGSTATTGKATILTAASNYSTDSSTWGGSTTKFKMTSTFTPGQAGFISVVLKFAAASTTFYIDPKVVIS